MDRRRAGRLRRRRRRQNPARASATTATRAIARGRILRKPGTGIDRIPNGAAPDNAGLRHGTKKQEHLDSAHVEACDPAGRQGSCFWTFPRRHRDAIPRQVDLDL